MMQRQWLLAAVAGAAMMSTALGTVAAQTPMVTVNPYRLVLSGPAEASSASDATYRVEYQRVNANVGGPGFVFNWPSDAASLVSSSVTAGSAGVMSEMGPGAISWDFSSDVGDSGVVQIVLHIDSTFRGQLKTGIYVRGTGIALPEASVDSVLTQVAGSRGLANTGGGPDSGTGDAVPGLPVLLLGGMALLGASAVLLRSRRTS
jgi:hypothetical protein